MDTVQLFFFKTPRDAEAAQAALAQYYVYLKAPFAYLRGLHLRRVPPTKAAAEATERVDGNVDVFWQYPRIHPKASDKTLNKCLN